MIEVYEETALTPMSVAKMSGYTDWSSQPSMFKHYPEYLFRYKFGENEKLQPIEDARYITSKKIIGAKTYYQLNTPSAGNLHPIELYVQIRGIKGILSGIYHVDVGALEMVLVREVESEGIEPYIGLQNSFSGIIFIISCVPFRAEWKYGRRAIRYCYLDAGHQVGAISASLKLHRQKMTILSDFNKDKLNDFMGFKEDEFVMAALASGELRKKSINIFKDNLMYVCAVDYSELSNYLAKNISNNHLLKSEVTQITSNLKKVDIDNRRSTRFFKDRAIDEDKLEYFLQLANGSLHFLSCYYIRLRDSSKRAGVYLKGELLKEGLFAKQLSKILVEQSFVKNAEIIIVVTSKYFSANKLMQAGAFVHNLYLEAESQSLGCSGIGAFYDKKMQNFLTTNEYILYVCAIGEQQK